MEEEKLIDEDFLIESNTNKSLKAGIAWDFFDKAIDLDVTIVAVDNYSLEMDSAYYNQLSILKGAIVHSGDNKTGVGDGDDEVIDIRLSELGVNCFSLWFIVNAYSGGNFTDVETATFTLYDSKNKSIHSSQITMKGLTNTALLLGVLYRDINEIDWRYKKIEKAGSGLNFVESRYLMENELHTIYSAEIINDRPRDRTKKYDLAKSESYVINPAIPKVVVGLGWDPASGGGDIDVDGSVIVFNDNGNDGLYKSEVIYYGNLTDKTTNCIKHHGDNLTGAGDGDDEVIDINLHKINDYGVMHTLCVVINIYNGASSFNQIENCFARLMDDKGNELCRYTLSGNYNTRGMIMCSINKKQNGCWALNAFGVGCKGKVANDSSADALRVCLGQEPLGGGGGSSSGSNTQTGGGCCVIL